MSVYGPVRIGGEGESLAAPDVETNGYLDGYVPIGFAWNGKWYPLSNSDGGCPQCGGTSFSISTSDGITTKTCTSCGHSMQG